MPYFGINQRFYFHPIYPISVRHAPESLCAMLRNECAAYPGITVRHGADFALPSPAIQDLYEIICERYENGSILLTSNRALEEWGEVFEDELLASAALDRLTHHSHTVVIQGESFRQLSRRKEALIKAKST